MTQTVFAGVEDTLFIPLAARVTASRRFPEYFYDAKALELENLEQVKRIAEKSSEYSFIASVARYYNMDRFTQDFLERHNGGNIINLGAGLESLNYRVNHPKAHFYSVDFPKVIDARRRILGQAENETLIACDITDFSWSDGIDKQKPCLLIASGVFQYFKPEAVTAFIQRAKALFLNAELVFDATNEVGIRYAQKYVKKTGNTSAMMYFYINDAEAFAREQGITLLQSRGFFAEARKMIGKKTGLYTRLAMFVADSLKRTILLDLQL